MDRFPDSHQDLLEAQFATLTTLAPDGSPRSSEIWFLHEDGQLRISLNDARTKTKDLLVRPRCSLFILDLSNPYRYVDIRGTAKIEDDSSYALADRVGAKYGGSDLREHDGPGDKRLAITIEPTKFFAVDMSR
jgi:PPOX class probable F420-dependent enzyme